jgi:hypothetical protein
MESESGWYRRIAGPKGSVSRLVVTLAAIMVFYIFIGMLFYNFHAGLGARDSLYFIVVTTMALGYGDIHPRGVFGKSFTMVYALIGVGVIVVCLRRFIQLLVNQRELALKKRKERKMLKADGQIKTKLGLSFNPTPNKLLGRLNRGKHKVETVVVVARKKLEVNWLQRKRKEAISTYPRIYRGTEIVFVLWVYICLVAALLYRLSVLTPHQEYHGCIYFTVITGLTIGCVVRT